MNSNFNKLKKIIVRLTSIGEIPNEWKKTRDEITELENQFKKLKDEFPDEAFDDDVFISSIDAKKIKLNDLNIQLSNLINTGDYSCMIFLKDNSRFIINFETITYLLENKFIDDDLYNRMITEEETRLECIKPTDNKLIPYFYIIHRLQSTIIIKDVCSTEDEVIRLNKYLLTENIFKMLLFEYDCLSGVKYNNISLVYYVGKPTNSIMYLLLNELNRLKQWNENLNYMFVVKTICNPSERTVCKPIKQYSLPQTSRRSSSSSSSSSSSRGKLPIVPRENIFGWILEADKSYNRVLIFFKIVNGVLYTLNTQLDKSTQYKYKYHIDNTRFSITYTETKMNVKTGETENYIIPIVTIHDGKIQLDNIPDFNNKTLKNDHITDISYKYDKYTEHNINRIQIYEINGEITHENYIQTTPKLFDLVREFNFSEEAMKDILHKVTHTQKESIQIDCSLPDHCPVHNPYFCPSNSAFRNNIKQKTFFTKETKTPSKGNNSPCVPSKDLCNLSYTNAGLRLDNQYYENKKMPPRNYFSKPRYCKIDQYLDDKQMPEFDGGSVNSNKKRNRRYSRKKMTKMFKATNRSKRF